MKIAAAFGLTATLVLCAVAAPAYPSSYVFTTLDDPLASNPRQGEGTFAQGINDDGQVVGYYYDSGGNAHGFLFSRGKYTTLDDPSTVNNQTFPEGINSKGQIVGWYDDRSRGHGFVYSAGVYTPLDDPSATVNTVARGINDKGQIVGYYQTGDARGNLINHGFVYSGGTYKTLDDPSAVSSTGAPSSPSGTAALGINNKGQIVGYYEDSKGYHGFLYSDGKYTTLNDPLGANGTFAAGINDLGQIVGYYYDSLNDQHGFIYDGATYTTVDDPSGVSGTYATGINNRGQIVGYYLIGSGTHGFLATPDVCFAQGMPVLHLDQDGKPAFMQVPCNE